VILKIKLNTKQYKAMDAKINSLIESLSQKTINKEANWERPGKADQYTLNLENGIVKLDKIVTKMGTIQYQFSIVNQTGDVIIRQHGTRPKDAKVTSVDYTTLKQF
jgi:hypothetical protein